MNRPQISDFFPESFTPKDLNKVFLANPELYEYIQALDGYIGYLEGDDQSGQTCRSCGEEFKNIDSVKVDYCKDCMNKTEPCSLSFDNGIYDCIVCGKQFPDFFVDQCGFVEKEPEKQTIEYIKKTEKAKTFLDLFKKKHDQL